MTQIKVDEKLLALAHQASGASTEEQTVAAALEEFVCRREQMRVVELFGTVEYDPEYDYKQQRKRA